MSEDKKAIWTDCPHCARKHLLAAYALLTQGQDNDNRVSVGTFRLLLARAEIAITEAQSGGYIGNASLASGCLAAAECIAAQHLKLDLRHELRDVRLSVDKLNLESAITGLWNILSVEDTEARAAAHLAEARRELPDMWDKALGDFIYGFYRCADKAALLAAIVAKVREIESLYELGAGSGDPEAPLNPGKPGKPTEEEYSKVMTGLAKQAAEQIEKVVFGPHGAPTLRKKKGKTNG